MKLPAYSLILKAHAQSYKSLPRLSQVSLMRCLWLENDHSQITIITNSICFDCINASQFQCGISFSYHYHISRNNFWKSCRVFYECSKIVHFENTQNEIQINVLLSREIAYSPILKAQYQSHQSSVFRKFFKMHCLG